MLLGFVLCFLSLWALTGAQAQIQTFWPAAAPLAVRSPYLNVWQAAISTNDYPVFWDGSVCSFTGNRTRTNLMVLLGYRVGGLHPRRRQHVPDPRKQLRHVGRGGWDRVQCDLLGGNPYADDPNRPSGPDQCDAHLLEPDRGVFLDRTRLCLVCMTLPHSQPADWVKQSTPFSYLAVDFASTDGQKHSVQIYSDISAGKCLLPRVIAVYKHLERMGIRRQGQHSTMEHRPDQSGRISLN